MQDDRINGINGDVALKASVRAATTANITLSGLQTVDGVALASGDRVLVKNQTTSAENGIYIADTSNWQRSTDFNGSYDAVQGTLIPVFAGTANAGSIWKLDTSSPVIGTSSLSFTKSNPTLPDLAASSGSSLLGFLPFGTGASATTVEKKLQESRSIYDFLTPAERLVASLRLGTLDMTTSVQKALDSGAYALLVNDDCRFTVTSLTISAAMCLHGRGMIDRTTVISSPLITVSASNVTIDGPQLQGAGHGATIVTTNSLDNAIQAAGTDSTAPLQNIHVRNTKIDGFAGFGVYLKYCRDSSAVGNRIANCGYCGIGGLSLIDSVIANNRINNIDSSGAVTNWYGIFLTRDPALDTTTSSRSTGCRIYGNTVSRVSQWTGIDMHAAYKCDVFGNNVYYCKNGIYAQYDSSTAAYKQPSEDCKIFGNTVEGRTTASENALGIASIGLAALPNNRIDIFGNTITGCGDYNGTNGALYITSTTYGTAYNNTLEKCIRNGISLAGTSQYCTIRDNRVNGVKDGASAGSRSFLWVDHTNLTGCRVADNVFGNTTGDANYSPTYGIFYNGSSTQAILSKNRINALSGSNYLQKSGGSANVYTDFAWELETETIKFNYTTTGGSAFESMGSKSASFRRLPATGGTPIYYSRVTFDQPNAATAAYRVRGNYGSLYTPAVFRYDGAAVAAALTLTDVTMSLTGVFWTD